MKQKIIAAVLASSLVAACDGNPFAPDEVPEEPNPELPPGTDNPTPDGSITRFEEFDAETGNGFAESISYDAVNDEFFVDNLAFDGDNTYSRDSTVPGLDKNGPNPLGPFQVYENDSTINDPRGPGNPINQLPHKAIYAMSTTGDTELAIVRTGGYVDYGFGGFLYQRNTGFSIPTTGQATYRGDYAGLRDFLAAGGLEYVTADATIDIDFEDFNAGDGVKGRLSNRQVWDLNGNNISGGIIAAINDPDSGFQPVASLPVILFDIGPSVSDENGEVTGTLGSALVNDEGALVDYESGSYFALLAGDNSPGGADGEIVGIVVVTSEDPRAEGVTARETGGFIAYRP